MSFGVEEQGALWELELHILMWDIYEVDMQQLKLRELFFLHLLEVLRVYSI